MLALFGLLSCGQQQRCVTIQSANLRWELLYRPAAKDDTRRAGVVLEVVHDVLDVGSGGCSEHEGAIELPFCEPMSRTAWRCPGGVLGKRWERVAAMGAEDFWPVLPFLHSSISPSCADFTIASCVYSHTIDELSKASV